MNAVMKLVRGLRVTFAPKMLPEPEPINAKPRSPTGLFAKLTPDQKAAALAYRGPEDHGDRNFVKA